MASPSTAINRFDLSMAYSEFDALANANKFIALKVLPPVGVSQNSATFQKISLAEALRKQEDTKRAPGTSYSRDDYTWTTDSYLTADYGAEEVLDDRRNKMYRTIFSSEQKKVQRAAYRVLNDLEGDVASAVFNTSTWTGSSLTTNGTNWTAKASGTPIVDIDAAQNKVRTNCGEMANAIILSDVLFKYLIRCDEVTSLIKYSGHTDPKMVGVNAVKELFELDHVIIGRGIKNTADQGQTASLSSHWDDTMCMVCKIDYSNDLEPISPCIGRTIMWEEENERIPGNPDEMPQLIVEEYREENKRGSVYRARMDRQVKILHAEAGHLLTGLNA